jgi:hypothetical protein
MTNFVTIWVPLVDIDDECVALRSIPGADMNESIALNRQRPNFGRRAHDGQLPLSALHDQSRQHGAQQVRDPRIDA